MVVNPCPNISSPSDSLQLHPSTSDILPQVQIHNYQRISDPEEFFAVVQAMQTPLKKLVVDRAGVDGRKVAARIAPLTQLQHLEMISCYPPTVPTSLTALTRLKLENAPSYCYPDVTTSFAGNLSMFSSLQVRTITMSPRSPFSCKGCGSSIAVAR